MQKVLILFACLLGGAGGSALAEERLNVTSADGTRIVVRKSGDGRAYLLIHGLGVDGRIAWARVAPLLSRTNSVYVMDLRGHGESGDNEAYSLENDVDDIAAVTRAIGRPLTVVAHSYGGLAVVASLDRLTHVTRLILYEPAVLVGPTPAERLQLLEELDKAIDAKDLDRAKVTGMRIVGMPTQVVEQLRASPAWAEQLSIKDAERARTRFRAQERFRISSEKLNTWSLPTRMLLGSRTTGYLQQSAKWICSSLPACELVLLEGQGHLANDRAPDLFLSKIAP